MYLKLARTSFMYLNIHSFMINPSLLHRIPIPPCVPCIKLPLTFSRTLLLLLLTSLEEHSHRVETDSLKTCLWRALLFPWPNYANLLKRDAHTNVNLSPFTLKLILIGSQYTLLYHPPGLLWWPKSISMLLTLAPGPTYFFYFFPAFNQAAFLIP